MRKARHEETAGLCSLTGEVPFRAAKPLLLDHPDFDFGVHVRMKTNRYAIHAERLDRLLQVHLTLLDREALLGQLLCDVRGSDRAEQLALFANPGRKCERDLLELGRELLRRAAT